MTDRGPLLCSKCSNERDIKHSYCLPCRQAYGTAYRAANKHVAWKPKVHGPTKEFPGVDIDAVHRNPRWMKIKEAA